VPYAPKSIITPGVSAQNLAVVFSEIDIQLRAGINVGDAVEQAGQSGPLHLRQAMSRIASGVRAGNLLSQEMERYGNIFNPAVPSLIAAGERSGNLDMCCATLSEHFEHEAETRRIVINAMIYPSIVVIVAILAVGILAWINFMESTWAVRLLWATGIAVGIWLLLRFRLAQQIARYFVMLTPFFGKLMQQLAVVRFLEVFGMTVRAGVPYLEGLEATLPVVQHPVVGHAAKQVYATVRNGLTVEEGIRAQPAFPSMVRNLVGAGEQAGSLDASLLKAAKYLRDDARHKIANAAKTLGPVMIIILGVIVAFILIAFWQSYFGHIMSIFEE